MPDKLPPFYQHHDATPGEAADRSAKTALHDSFPASDPIATTAAVGVRAVDLNQMKRPPLEIGDATILTARFPDGEAAKLTVERLVRKIPLDPRRATAQDDEEGGVIIHIAAPKHDVERILQVLREGGMQNE